MFLSKFSHFLIYFVGRTLADTQSFRGFMWFPYIHLFRNICFSMKTCFEKHQSLLTWHKELWTNIQISPAAPPPEENTNFQPLFFCHSRVCQAFIGDAIAWIIQCVRLGPVAEKCVGHIYKAHTWTKPTNFMLYNTMNSNAKKYSASIGALDSYNCSSLSQGSSWDCQASGPTACRDPPVPGVL